MSDTVDGPPPYISFFLLVVEDFGKRTPYGVMYRVQVHYVGVQYVMQYVVIQFSRSHQESLYILIAVNLLSIVGLVTAYVTRPRAF